MFRLALLLVGTCALIGLSACGVSPSIATCQADEQIASTERARIQEVAASFVDKALSPSPASMLDEMTASGRAEIGPDVLNMFKLMSSVRTVEPGKRKIVQTLRAGGIGGRVPILCLSQEPVFVGPGVSPQSAFVTIAEEMPGDGARRWTLWLESENGRWGVRAFHIGLSAIAGRDGRQLWSTAREQHRLGNTLNAAILYDAARIALDHGPFLQEEQFSQFTQEYSQTRRLLPLVGPPPLTLSLGEQSYTIASANAASTADRVFAIQIDRPRPSGTLTESEADRLNRQLIDALNIYRPEWRSAFSGIFVRTSMGDGRTWTTVYTASRGYIADTRRR